MRHNDQLEEIRQHIALTAGCINTRIDERILPLLVSLNDNTRPVIGRSDLTDHIDRIDATIATMNGAIRQLHEALDRLTPLAFAPNTETTKTSTEKG